MGPSWPEHCDLKEAICDEPSPHAFGFRISESAWDRRGTSGVASMRPGQCPGRDWRSSRGWPTSRDASMRPGQCPGRDAGFRPNPPLPAAGFNEAGAMPRKRPFLSVPSHRMLPRASMRPGNAPEETSISSSKHASKRCASMRPGQCPGRDPVGLRFLVVCHVSFNEAGAMPRKRRSDPPRADGRKRTLQ